MFTSNSIYSALFPMYLVTQILGLTPFSITGIEFRSSKLGMIWSLLFMFVMATWSIYSLDFSEREADDSVIAVITNFLDSCFSQIGLLINILFSCIFANNVVRLLKSIEGFDQNAKIMFKQLNLPREYSKIRKMVVISLSITLIIILFLIIMVTRNISTDGESTLKIIGVIIELLIPTIVNTLVVFQFCVLVMCFKQRFEWINDEAHALLKKFEIGSFTDKELPNKIDRVRPSSCIVVSGICQDETLYFIEGIRIKHFQLCEDSKLLNRAYSAQNFIILFQNFITIIAALLFTGKNIINHRDRPEALLEYIFYSGIAFILAVLQILIIVICCSNTISEAGKTKVLINEFISSNVTIQCSYKKELYIEIIYFSVQLLHQQVRFIACRICKIEEPLIFTIIGALTSYLIIIIQFEIQQFHNSANETHSV